MDKDGFRPSLDPDGFFTSFQLEHQAYNLSTDEPYNTVQLIATGLFGDNTPVPAEVVYSVSHPTAVEISPTGVLTAKAAVTNAVIYASMTYQGFTRRDSALLGIIDGLPAEHLKRLAIALNPSDSAKISNTAGNKIMQLIREDSAGNQMTAVRVALRSSDTLTARISLSGTNVSVQPRRPGPVMLYASTYAYGVAQKDSMSFIVGWPLWGLHSTYERIPTGTRQPVLDFFPGTFTMGVGGCIAWANLSEDLDIDITFEDPAKVAAPAIPGNCALLGGIDPNPGNIPPFRIETGSNGQVVPLSQFRARAFLEPGVYNYYSTLHGTKGRIIVCDEANDSTCAPENIKW